MQFRTPTGQFMPDETPIVYLREVDAGTDNACWVVCSKGDPGAVTFVPAEEQP